MNVKTWLPICLALVLGVIAAKLANDAVSSRQGGNASAAVKLVVAKRPIAPGEALAAADLEIRPIAADAPPDGAYTSPSDLIGRTAQAQLVKGQPVTESMLAAQGTASGLQALVPPGMRAMTVEVNEFSGVGGMVTPGSRVDVISIMQDPHLAESMSRTIVQNVLVKAVGQSTSTDAEKKEAVEIVKSVTLIVTPKQAEAIQLSTLSGRPWLILRGNGDSTVAALAGTTLTELRGAPANIDRDPAIPHDTFVASAPSPAGQPPATVFDAPDAATIAMQAQASQRAVHAIRATVETTIAVAPSAAAAAAAVGPQDAFTGAAIEP